MAELQLNDSLQTTSLTSDERDLLMRLVERHRDSLFASNSYKKGETWWELTKAFNAQPGVSQKDPEQLQKCWMNLECPDHVPIVQTQTDLLMTSTPADYPASVVSTWTAMSPSFPTGSPCPELPDCCPMSSSLFATASQTSTSLLTMSTMPVMQMDIGKQISTSQGITSSFDLLQPALTSPQIQTSDFADDSWKSSTRTAALSSCLPLASSGVGHQVPLIKIVPPDTETPPTSPFSTLKIEGVSYPVYDSTRLYPPIECLESGAILLPPPMAPGRRGSAARQLPARDESSTSSSPVSSPSCSSSSTSSPYAFQKTPHFRRRWRDEDL